MSQHLPPPAMAIFGTAMIKRRYPLLGILFQRIGANFIGRMRSLSASVASGEEGDCYGPIGIDYSWHENLPNTS
jgi:hypothetical protein